LAAKKDSKQEACNTCGSEGDQYNVRYTMLDVQLKEKGYQMDSSQEERDFIERRPTRGIMAMADLVHK
jgi:hypothetical protein